MQANSSSRKERKSMSDKLSDYQVMAETLASVIEHEDEALQPLVDMVNRHLEQMIVLADITHPATIRRLYPLMRQLAEERAAEAGQSFPEWLHSNTAEPVANSEAAN